MLLQEFIKLLAQSDRLRIVKNETEIFIGFLALFVMQEVYEDVRYHAVKKFRAIMEIRPKNWKKLGLEEPIEPYILPEFSFSDMQMNLYYTIYL